jgi:hypothetical protein
MKDLDSVMNLPYTIALGPLTIRDKVGLRRAE